MTTDVAVTPSTNPRHLRANHAALRGRDCFYYNQSSHTSAGIIATAGRRVRPRPRLPELLRHIADHDHSLPGKATFRERIDAADRPAPLDSPAPPAIR